VHRLGRTAVSDGLLAVVFVGAAAVSLATSWLLVSRLERIGARFGLAGHHSRIGAGVVIGSNVFNLAALLGLGALLAGEITLHRRVIIFEGTVAMVIAAVCLGVVLGGPGPGVGLLAAVAVLIPYLIVSGVRPQRLGTFGLPPAWVRWLSEAVLEEEQELESAIHPPRADARDVILAVLATGIVVGASVAMELTASTLGHRHHVAQIVIGGLVLAGVTSLSQRGLRALSSRPRTRRSHAQHRPEQQRPEQQRPERHHRSAAPRNSRRARRALRAGDPRCRVVSRADGRDVGVRICRPRAASIPRRTDHQRLPCVRRGRSHRELTALAAVPLAPATRNHLLLLVSKLLSTRPGSSRGLRTRSYCKDELRDLIRRTIGLPVPISPLSGPCFRATRT
jgi:hypothetical protein